MEAAPTLPVRSAYRAPLSQSLSHCPCVGGLESKEARPAPGLWGRVFAFGARIGGTLDLSLAPHYGVFSWRSLALRMDGHSAFVSRPVRGGWVLMGDSCLVL
jgi:hypothetical protein